MNLEQTIASIERAARRQPSINMIVRNDVFRINQAPSLKYGVFAWLQNQHTITKQFNSFSFTFFYVDRLTASKDNETLIQSTGIETLTNIVRTLEDLGFYTSKEIRMQTFNQRFADDCAGVFTNVSLETRSESLCEEKFYDFSLDYNNDYRNGDTEKDDLLIY